MKPVDLATAVGQLAHARSAGRKSAARWLRANPDGAAAEAIHAALEREIDDPRTWEVQYHLVCALAACASRRSVPLIRSLLSRPLAPMVHLAAGDALVRLADTVDEELKEALAAGPPLRLNGAVRALAMARRVPSQTIVDELLRRAEPPGDEQLRFWVAAAAPEWRGDAVRGFLERCLTDRFDETRRAAKLSLAGRYGAWRPL